MKKLIIVALAVAAATTMYAQGTVSMASKNAVTYGDSCGALAGQKIGDDFIGTLYYEGSAVASQAFNGVNAKTGEWTGKMNGSVLTIDGVPAGTAVTFTLHAQDATDLYKGDSAPFTYNTGNPAGTPPTTPDAKLAYDAFTVEYVPEPTTIALGILGLSSLLVLRRRD
jgi:hypothetical protein